MIIHICAHRAARPWHYGRQRRRKTKRTNVEVVVKEGVEIKKEGKKAETPKKEEKKVKGEQKVQEKKPEMKKVPVEKEVKEDKQK